MYACQNFVGNLHLHAQKALGVGFPLGISEQAFAAPSSQGIVKDEVQGQEVGNLVAHHRPTHHVSKHLLDPLRCEVFPHPLVSLLAFGNEPHVGGTALVPRTPQSNGLQRNSHHKIPRTKSVPRKAQREAANWAYNAAVTEGDRSLLACFLLVVVLALFYPALFLGQVLAPQAALWGYPPWSQLGGPNPFLHQPTNRLAFSLAPRLALIQREGTAVALWNPYIGGGRIGWLGMAADGYAPFSVVAALFAQDVHHWQALAFCVVILSFAGMFRLARRYLAPWPAVVSALVYTLSGPVVSAWLDVPGTVAAVVPWLLVFTLDLPRRGAVAGAALCAALLWVSGGYGWPWLAPPLLAGLVRSSNRVFTRTSGFLAVAAGLALAFPSLFLAYFGGESPGFWWLEGRLQSASSPFDLFAGNVSAFGAERPWVFFGWPALLLAVMGALSQSRVRALAVGLTFLGAVAAFAPSAVLPAFLASFRPTLALALGIALLAGAGSERLVARAPGSWQPVVSGIVVLSVFLRALPAASLWLPWHSRERARLPWEAPTVPGFQREDLVLPLVTLFPTDSAAMAGLADVRARRFSGEPKLRQWLAPAPDGSLHFSRLSDTMLAKLGVRWLLEPRELSLVSGELFSRLILAESQGQNYRFPVTVPAGVTRLGLKVPAPPSFVHLLQNDQRFVLHADGALAQEAEGWWWWLVPEGVEPGQAWLVLASHRPTWGGGLQLAWDCSGWELAHEAGSLRLWRQRWALPLAFFEGEAKNAGSLELLAASPQKLVVQTESPTAQRLGVRWKFRPHIHKAFLDGKPTILQQGSFPWSAVEVPAGSHRVTVKTSLPLAVWFGPLMALGILSIVRKAQL